MVDTCCQQSHQNMFDTDLRCYPHRLIWRHGVILPSHLRATGYGLDGPDIESRQEAKFSTPVQTDPGGRPSLLYNGYQVFPGGKERPGRDADPSPSVVVMKEQSYTSTPPMGRTACTVSVPVQGCTLPFFCYLTLRPCIVTLLNPR